MARASPWAEQSLEPNRYTAHGQRLYSTNLYLLFFCASLFTLFYELFFAVCVLQLFCAVLRFVLFFCSYFFFILYTAYMLHFVSFCFAFCILLSAFSFLRCFLFQFSSICALCGDYFVCFVLLPLKWSRNHISMQLLPSRTPTSASACKYTCVPTTSCLCVCARVCACPATCSCSVSVVMHPSAYTIPSECLKCRMHIWPLVRADLCVLLVWLCMNLIVLFRFR